MMVKMLRCVQSEVTELN